MTDQFMEDYKRDTVEGLIEENKRLRAVLVQFVACCDTAPPTSLMIELGMACQAARAALSLSEWSPRRCNVKDDNGKTHYSEKIGGDRGNHEWATRYDVTDNGYLGINQYEGEKLTDRVLLSPAQVQELIEFVRRHRSRRAA